MAKNLSSPVQNLLQLEQIPLFSGLTPAEIQPIWAAAHRKSVLDGEYYFLQGDPAERIYLLEQGRIKLSQGGEDGSQVLLRVIEAPHLFGAVGMTRGEVYPVSALAAGDGSALYWSKPEMMGFVLQLPKMALNAIQMMSAHVQEFQERFRQMATERVERRLARTILRLASQSGRKTEEGVLIDFPLSRQDLAEMCGTTLYTVSRTLSEWQAQGLVVTGRERVVVRYPHGLVRIAEDLPALE
jgi:CRP/FNR family transcriptional regulator, nitrogen oxide reductase regulator